MSRIGSSSAVRVAAQPLSNVYTVLLLVAVLALVVAFGVTAYTVQTHYPNGVLGYGEEVENDIQAAEGNLAGWRNRLGEHETLLEDAAKGAGTSGTEEGGAGSPAM
jgi:hypothetical protein